MPARSYVWWGWRLFALIWVAACVVAAVRLATDEATSLWVRAIGALALLATAGGIMWAMLSDRPRR